MGEVVPPNYVQVFVVLVSTIQKADFLAVRLEVTGNWYPPTTSKYFLIKYLFISKKKKTNSSLS